MVSLLTTIIIKITISLLSFFLIIVELSLKCDKDGSTKKGVCECFDNNI